MSTLNNHQTGGATDARLHRNRATRRADHRGVKPARTGVKPSSLMTGLFARFEESLDLDVMFLMQGVPSEYAPMPYEDELAYAF